MSCEGEDLSKLSHEQLELHLAQHKRNADSAGANNLIFNLVVFKMPFTLMDFSGEGRHKSQVDKLEEEIRRRKSGV